jgi:DNA-binding GntR family transcriptional regulator
MIEREGPVAPWRQVYEYYRQKIESGELPPGSRLPSISSLAQEYEIARTTAQKVIEQLRRDGLAVTSPMGTFVRNDDDD